MASLEQHAPNQEPRAFLHRIGKAALVLTGAILLGAEFADSLSQPHEIDPVIAGAGALMVMGGTGMLDRTKNQQQ